jgi:hypothetical protein
MYATLPELTIYLGIDDSTADDALLTACLVRAQAIVNSQTRRVFEAAADSTQVFGRESVTGRTLFLGDDLCAVTTVTNGEGVAIGSSDYVLLPRNRTPYHAIQLREDSTAAWTTFDGDISITGKWAYSLSAPADVVQATLRLAAWLYRQKDNVGGDSVAVVGDMTILPARLPADIAQLLAPYRRVLL